MLPYIPDVVPNIVVALVIVVAFVMAFCASAAQTPRRVLCGVDRRLHGHIRRYRSLDPVAVSCCAGSRESLYGRGVFICS